MGTASGFGIVASSTTTNTGAATLITGNLGVSPGNTAPGFVAGNVTGSINLGNAAATTAQADATTAFGTLNGQACDLDLTGTDLGGLTLTPGVYCFSTSAQLTGTLTLNGLGNAGAVWVFKTGSTLTTASGARVVYSNSGQSCGTFWKIGSSATLGSTTSFAGAILAQASVTLVTGAGNSGGLYALTGAVTVDTSQVTAVAPCGAGPVPAAPTPLPAAPVVPGAPGAPGAAPGVPSLPGVAAGGLLALLLITGTFVLGRR
jgi:type VI secretion system secreted protein VgrG